MKIKYLLVGTFIAFSQLSYATYDMYSVNLPDDAKPKINKKSLNDDLNEKNIKGFIERISDKYEYLNNIENRIIYDQEADIKSTRLKKNISEVITASKLKSVPSTAKVITLGYAPVGTFNKEMGWAGLTEIFKSKEVGTCQFTHVDLKISNGGYSLSEKDERRDVNGKYTFIEITGKRGQGFDYEIDWFEDLNMYTLNCINKEFSSVFTENVISLAKKIDSGD